MRAIWLLRCSNGADEAPIAWWLLQGMSNGPDRLSGRMNDPDTLVNSIQIPLGRSGGVGEEWRIQMCTWWTPRSSVVMEIWTAQINGKLIMKGIDLFKNAQSKLECSDAPVARFYSARCLVIDKEKIGPPRSNFLTEWTAQMWKWTTPGSSGDIGRLRLIPSWNGGCRWARSCHAAIRWVHLFMNTLINFSTNAEVWELNRE